MVVEIMAVEMVNGTRCNSCSSFQGVMGARLAVPWGPLSAQAEHVDIWQYLFNDGYCRPLPFDHRHADAEFC